MSNNIVYNVKNRSAGSVVYSVPELGVRRSFTPGEIKRISHNELEALSFQPGGKELMRDYLQIRNEEVLAQLNIDVEQEYFMDRAQVEELIKTGSLDQFIDALNFAPAGVIDMIKDLSVKIPLSDYNKRQALKDAFNFDVDAAIKNSVATEEETVTTAGPTRRSTPIVDESAKNDEPAAKIPVRRVSSVTN